MRQAAKGILRLSALATFLVLAVVAAAANPGDLDPTFGSGGKATVNFGSDGSDARAIVVQRDGKVVVGGWAGPANLALARLKPDGTLDSTFGPGGKVTITLVGSFDAMFEGLALQPDGKIVAAGIDYLTQDQSDFVVARFNSDGSPDTTFNGGGIVTTDFKRFDTAHAVVVQPDGAIVVAGDAIGPGGPAVALARYRPNGSLDPTFGSGGRVQSPVGIAAGTGLVRQPDGKLVVSATVADAGRPQFALIRFDADGSLDTSFGSAGVAEAAIGYSSVPFGVALQGDGKIVAAGNAADSYRQAAWGVVRVNADGAMDASFGQGGAVVTKTGPNGGFARAVAVQRNGKIVTAGDSPLYQPTDGSHATIVRYKPNGDPDPGFGKDGIVNLDFGNVEYNFGEGLALQGDGRILVAGATHGAGLIELMGLARLLGDTCVVPNVKRKPLTAARRMITRAGCSPGKVKKIFSRKIAKGRVISQKPAARASVAAATNVNLVVSKGKRRR